MKTNKKYCVIMTTFADISEMNMVIEALLDNKLAACVQVVNIGSHYIWNNKLCHEDEMLLLIKTLWIKYEQIRDMIKNYHSYDIPEIIAINIEDGYKPYMDWILKVTK